MTKITHSVAEYIRLKDERRNATMVRKNGKSSMLHEGKLIPMKQFDQLHPIPIYRRANEKGVNPCRKKNFLFDSVSY